MQNMFKNILLVISSVLIITVIVEVVLRLYAPIYHAGYIGVYQYDAELGSVLKPGIHKFNTTDYQQEVRTNKLDTVNFQDSFKNYKKLIFTLGDSYTQGTGLPSDASYPAQLDLILNLKNGIYRKDYGVVNLGLAAFGTDQEILTLLRYKDRIGVPDVILYMGCSNDYLDDLKFEQGYKHRNFVDGSPVWGIFVKPLQWFRNDFEIGKRIFFFVDKIRVKNILHRDRDVKDSGHKVSVAELQADKLEKLLSYSRKFGSRLIVSWANGPSYDGSYEFLKNWAGKRDVLFADWYPEVASVRQAIPALPLQNSHSGGHYRTWVNQVMARTFAGLIFRLQ